MTGFFEGNMRATDYLANRDARFHPAVDAGDNNGTYAPPCLEVAGVQVYAYVRDGILVVSVDYDTADLGTFATYGEACIPTVISAGPEQFWTAVPDDAITEADHALLRKTGADRPGDWVIPGWAEHYPY